jgi:hypothetical protein
MWDHDGDIPQVLAEKFEIRKYFEGFSGFPAQIVLWPRGQKAGGASIP